SWLQKDGKKAAAAEKSKEQVVNA
ncbi:MAG: hypothetical protein QOD84_1997, partial [Acidobacteriaceae bacterium]